MSDKTMEKEIAGYLEDTAKQLGFVEYDEPTVEVKHVSFSETTISFSFLIYLRGFGGIYIEFLDSDGYWNGYVELIGRQKKEKKKYKTKSDGLYADDLVHKVLKGIKDSQAITVDLSKVKI